ncbi:MAG: hypothetical protein Q7R70_03260 [Candidatus Diapherotrites archaeon]|nr:hypothetical protein [Candidatus Diapherotrites archaeon]
MMQKESVSKNIIAVLSEEWPLNAKEVYHKVQRNLGRNLSYQAIHKCLTVLLDDGIITKKEREYSLNPIWLKEINAFTRRVLENYESGKECKDWVNAKIFFNRKESWNHLCKIISKAKNIKLSSKTPGLIFESERYFEPDMGKYLDALIAKIEKNEIFVKYLIAGDLTKSTIIEKKDKQAFENLKKLSKLENMELRYAPLRSINSMAITEKELMLGFTLPSNMHSSCWICIKGLKDFSEIYDQIFENSQPITKLIAEIEKAFKKSK